MIHLDHRFKVDTYDNDFYCGIDPVDNRFFVGRSEAVFNPTFSERLKSEDDIRQLNTDRLNEQLLLHSFKNLKHILARQVIQYRIVYTKDRLLTRQKQEDRYTTFSPLYNTYYIPYDSNFAKKVRGSKIGIIITKQYRGSNLDDMRDFPIKSIESFKNRYNVIFMKYDERINIKKYQIMKDLNHLIPIKKLGDSEVEITETINSSNY